jgi:hypothetical protein
MASAWTVGRGLPIRPVDVISGDMWMKGEHTLARIAERGQREGVIFCLENLNTAVDHPGTPYAKAADTLALVAAVDSPASATDVGHLGQPSRFRVIDQVLSADIRHWSVRPRQALRLWVLR